MDYNTPDIRKGIISIFPKLNYDENFYVNSPFTFQYNCIAWAMNIEDRWVDENISIPWHWWPNDALRNGSEKALIDAFKKLSFVETENEFFEEGYDKVALYSKDGQWKHAARLMPKNFLHSKLGALYDAFHSKGNVLDNIYGSIYIYMKRPITHRHISNDVKGESAGEIHTNEPIPGTDIFLVFYKGGIFDEDGNEYQMIAGKLELKYK